MISYFAYGSNVSPSVFRTRCAGSKFVGVARLDGYRIAFTRRSLNWGGGVADLLPDPTRSVWGSVFELTPEDLNRLDVYEGAPKAYARKRVSVVGPTGLITEVWCYFVTTKGPECVPSYRYWKAIVDGAHEAGLPADYVEHLNALPHAREEA